MHKEKSKKNFINQSLKMQIQTQKTSFKEANQIKQYKKEPNQTLNQQSTSIESRQLYDVKKLEEIGKQLTKQNKQIKKSNIKVQQSHQVINSVQKNLFLSRQQQKHFLAQRISLLKNLQINMKQKIEQWAATDRVTPQQMEQRRLYERQYEQLKYIKQRIDVEYKKLMVNHKILDQMKRDLKQNDEILQNQIKRKQALLQQEDKKTIRLRKLINEQGKQNKQLYMYKKEVNNLLQKERGNIRVYCRLRPSKQSMSELKIKYQVMENMIVLKKKNTTNNYGLMNKQKNYQQEKSFVFDRIFQENVNQVQLYDNLRDIIQCTVDGQDVCIFAYGQTGSGKTYTMEGPLDDLEKDNIDEDKINEEMGVIPRALQQIFYEVQVAEKNEFTALIEVSISEIYNNCHYDLLDARKQKQSKNLAFLTIHNFKEGMLALKKAMNLRSTASTKKNQHSSRSHLIMQVKNQFKNLNPKNRNSKEQIRVSSLVMIDLAGSERLQQSQVSGERFKQMTEINKSLTELGKVFRSIKEGKQQPSFRSSKLTMALQPFLEGGKGTGVMFVNISPQTKDFEQTWNSLKFAEGVRQTKINNKKDEKIKSRQGSKDSKSSQTSSKGNNQNSNNQNLNKTFRK